MFFKRSLLVLALLLQASCAHYASQSAEMSEYQKGQISYAHLAFRDRLKGSNLTITKSGDSVKLTQDSTFAFVKGTSNISDSAEYWIGVAAAVLNKYPTLSVAVIGHSNHFKSEIHNQALSEGQAGRVSTILATFGVHMSRLHTDGSGSTHIASNPQVTSTVEIVVY